MEVGKDTKFTLSIETGISILVTVGMIIGMWYSLQAEIELAKELPEPEVSRMEYDLKDQMIRDSILNTENKVDKLEEKVDDIKEDTKAITQTLIDMNNKWGWIMKKFILSLCLWLGLSSTWLHSQSVNLDNFQAIQLMSLEECAVVQVNASWNFANRLDIAKLKDCYIAEVDLTNKAIGAVIQKEWSIKVVPTIIIFQNGKEVKRFEAGISMKFDEQSVLENIRKEIKK